MHKAPAEDLQFTSCITATSILYIPLKKKNISHTPFEILMPFVS